MQVEPGYDNQMNEQRTFSLQSCEPENRLFLLNVLLQWLTFVLKHKNMCFTIP